MTDGGLFSQLVLRIAGGLLHFFWQGAALAVLAFVCLAFLERRPARTRYAVAVGFLAAMLAAPLLTVFFFDSADAILTQTLLLLGQPPVERLKTEQWAFWIAAIWVGGVATGWIRLAVGWRLSLRMIRQACAPDPDVLALFDRVVQQTKSGAVRLLVCARAVSPVVIGWFRPVVLLPVTVLTGLSVDELRVVVAHELAHVRRHDYLVNILQRVVESLLFYHPAVWWLSARVRTEREHAADEAAIEICDDPAVLARALVRLEETRADRIAAVAATGGNVANRVARILKREPERSGWQPLMATLSFMILWGTAGLWPRTVTAPPQASSTANLAPVETVATGLRALAAVAPAPAEKAVATQTQGVVNGQIRAPRLNGRVIDKTGRPALPKLWVRAKPEVETIPNVTSFIAETDIQGRYEMNIPPGRYTVLVEDGDRVPRGIVQGLPRMITVPAEQDSVNVDLDYITVARNALVFQIPDMGPDYLMGKIEVDDRTSLPVGALGQFRVSLSSGGSSLTTQPFTNTQGIFMFPVVPGEYRVTFSSHMRLGYYLKSMRYGSIDLTKSPLSLKTGGPDNEIRILLTKSRPADLPPGVRVSGRVTDWRAANRELALFAATTAGDVFQVAEVAVDYDGTFVIEAVPPGHYGLGSAQRTPKFFFDVGRTDVTKLEFAIPGAPGEGFPVPMTGTGKYIRGVVESGNGATVPQFEIRFTDVRPEAVSMPPQVVRVSGREFSTILPEGIFRVSVSGLAQGYSLKSATSGPFDLTQPFLITFRGVADRLSGNSVSSAGEITIKLNGSSSAK